MSDPLRDDDPPWKRIVGWWRSQTPFETFGSVATFTTFIGSAMTWIAAPVWRFNVFEWLMFWSALAALLSVSLFAIKILGQLTGNDDLRWKSVLLWEVLLLIALAHNYHIFGVAAASV